MGKKIIDLTGQTFERLYVIKRVENNKHGNAQWLCKCSCEDKNIKIICGSSLKDGSTKSCGCLKKEKVIIFNQTSKRKYSKYCLTGNFGIGHTKKGEDFYFDLEDFNSIKDYCWRLDKDNYVVTDLNDKHIKMHRLVMNCPDDMDIDHRFHIHYDNRKSGLRIVTTSQNCMNRGLHSNNTSGVTGVCWHKNNEKWMVQINIDGKPTNLGYFSNLEDATKVRKVAEEKYYKEYSYQNSIRKVGD